MTTITSFALAVAGWLRGATAEGSRAPILAGLLWVWMWMLLWGNTNNPDLDGYLYLYASNQTTAGIEPGYWVLVRLARGAGLEYSAFLAVTAGAALLILAVVASWFTSRTSLVAVLYFIYPFVYDAIQARNLLGMSLVVLGFALRSRLRRRGTFWFVVTVSLGATLHVTMLVFLVALPVLGKHGKAISQAGVLLGMLVTPVVALFPSVIGKLGDLILRQLDTSTGRYEGYFATQGSFGIVMYAVLHALTLLLMRHTLSLISREGGQAPNAAPAEPKGLKLARLTYRSGMAITALLPLVAINSNFFRLFRNLWFLYVVCFCVGLDSESRSPKFGTMLVMTTGLAALHFTAFVLWGFDRLASPLLNYNRILPG